MAMQKNSDHQVLAKTDIYPVYELVENSTDSRVTICPERGGIVISFVSKGRELLYLDRETYADPAANIRGGIPVLFPISGQLPGGRYEWEGEAFTIKNHGVARDRAWEVVGTDEDGQASLTLRLTDSAATYEVFPFHFELVFTYRLKDGKLGIQQGYRNHSDRPLPMYAGFHPYFALEPGPVHYRTDATRMLDYNDMAEKAFSGTLDLSGMVEAVALLDAQKPEIGFEVGEGTLVRLRYSDVFRYVVLWTAANKPFVCVEPWMAKNGEMLRGDELVRVAPGETLQAEFVIETA